MRVDLTAVHKRTIETEVRVSTAVNELTDTVMLLRETIVGWRAEHRADRELLRNRLDSIESRLGER